MAKPIAKKEFKELNGKMDAEFIKIRLDLLGMKHLRKEATKYDQLMRLGAQVSAWFYGQTLIN